MYKVCFYNTEGARLVINKGNAQFASDRVGEFHFGALDRGMFHPGLVGVADQKER